MTLPECCKFAAITGMFQDDFRLQHSVSGNSQPMVYTYCRRLDHRLGSAVPVPPFPWRRPVILSVYTSLEVHSMNNRLVISSTIGFMCIGLTLWMMNLAPTHWVAGPDMHAMIMAFTLGTVVLGVMAILSFFHGRTLDAVIFFGFAGLLFTVGHGMGHMQAAGGDSSGTIGWFGLG